MRESHGRDGRVHVFGRGQHFVRVRGLGSVGTAVLVYHAEMRGILVPVRGLAHRVRADAVFVSAHLAGAGAARGHDLDVPGQFLARFGLQLVPVAHHGEHGHGGVAHQRRARGPRRRARRRVVKRGQEPIRNCPIIHGRGPRARHEQHAQRQRGAQYMPSALVRNHRPSRIRQRNHRLIH